MRELVSEPDNYDVKFRLTGWDKKTYLSINLVILKVPAEAAVWQLQLDGKAATQDTTDVRCGEPFQLLVEAHDKFGNRHVPAHTQVPTKPQMYAAGSPASCY